MRIFILLKPRVVKHTPVRIKILPYAPAKYEALKNYAKRHGVKWAFIRDYDEKLWYLNDGE